MEKILRSLTNKFENVVCAIEDSDVIASLSLLNSLRKSTTTFSTFIFASSISALSRMSISIVCRKFTASIQVHVE